MDQEHQCREETPSKKHPIMEMKHKWQCLCTKRANAQLKCNKQAALVPERDCKTELIREGIHKYAFQGLTRHITDPSTRHMTSTTEKPLVKFGQHDSLSSYVVGNEGRMSEVRVVASCDAAHWTERGMQEK